MTFAPTAQLRWVRRLVDSGRDGPVRELVLQQWWNVMSVTLMPDASTIPSGQWRDVPVVDERDEPRTA